MLASVGIQTDLAFTPRYNIAPTQEASIVALDAAGTPEHKRARWGLIPVWTKSSSIPASLINARAETVATRPSFRTAFHKRRCLVLADGFYEWQKHPEGNHPIYIRLREGEPFAFGGVWEQWRDEDRLVDSFCVVTVEPNELCRTVHDRMPLILSDRDFALWLDAATDIKLVQALMKPFHSARMERYPVSSAVNNARNETAACIERVADRKPAQSEFALG